MRKKNRSAVALVAFLVVLVCAMASMSLRPASAQRETGTLDVRTLVASDSYQALKERPIMISVIRDGQVVKQQDGLMNSNAAFALPAGLYDVRLEVEGMQTLVKRGIHVNEGQRTDIIGAPVRTGVGVKVIEYATEGLSREEVAARLAKLEAAVAELQKSRAR